MTSLHSQACGVVGAGLVGLAIARRLAHAGNDVVVFEKEDDVAVHQSGHNSGVVHSGIYYAPGSLKATLCRRGVTLLREYCAERGLPYQEIGKVVVARNDVEVGRLRDIETRARANGVPGVRSGGELHVLDRLTVCAGLQSDTVSTLAGDELGPAIVAFRGEYFRLVPERRELVRGLVYPVPDPAYPFLGVHFTPRIDGSVDIGPNAVPAFATEGHQRGTVPVPDLWRELRWPGTWKLFRRHWQMGLQEMRGSLSVTAYLRGAQAYIPSLTRADVVRAPAGVRAQALDANGSLVDDFRIHTLGPVTAVRNAPSPAATSSLAIAEHVTDQMARAAARRPVRKPTSLTRRPRAG